MLPYLILGIVDNAITVVSGHSLSNYTKRYLVGYVKGLYGTVNFLSRVTVTMYYDVLSLYIKVK